MFNIMAVQWLLKSEDVERSITETNSVIVNGEGLGGRIDRVLLITIECCNCAVLKMELSDSIL